MKRILDHPNDRYLYVIPEYEAQLNHIAYIDDESEPNIVKCFDLDENNRLQLGADGELKTVKYLGKVVVRSKIDNKYDRPSVFDLIPKIKDRIVYVTGRAPLEDISINDSDIVISTNNTAKVHGIKADYQVSTDPMIYLVENMEECVIAPVLSTISKQADYFIDLRDIPIHILRSAPIAVLIAIMLNAKEVRLCGIDCYKDDPDVDTEQQVKMFWEELSHIEQVVETLRVPKGNILNRLFKEF